MTTGYCYVKFTWNGIRVGWCEDDRVGCESEYVRVRVCESGR